MKLELTREKIVNQIVAIKNKAWLCRWASVGALMALLLLPSLAAAEPPLPADLTAEARDILRQLDADKIQTRIDRLGAALGMAADKAPAILDALAKDNTVQAATLRAELLLWLARGAEAWDAPRKGEMSTDDLGGYAGDLLDHADPFVRGVAEWAIATRLGMEYECAESTVQGKRITKDWPGAGAPSWYQRWAAIGPEAALELDYVRQAVAVGSHRTTSGLLKSGEVLVKRAGDLRAHLEKQGVAQAADIEARYAQVKAAFEKLGAAAKAAPAELTAQRVLWIALRRASRDVALANPDLDFAQVVFGVRQASLSGGNITGGRWNVHTPGGDIFIKTGFAPQDPVKPLLQGRLGPGHVRGLELNWEADKLVLGYARQGAGADSPLREKSDIGGYFGQGIGQVEEMSHLFEVRLDGTGLRQLTDAKYNADQEPTYLPNGDIAFVSDRSNFGSQCAGALEQDNMILNLFRCDPDGKNIRSLSNNKDFDRHPHVMDNGQLLFLHWEYQERHLWQTHSLWTCRPDGSMTDAIYKQHIESGPMSLREARQIPGTQKLVTIACGHHNYDQGAVFIADYALGINEREGMRNVTPGVSGTEGGYGGVKPVVEGGVADRGGHYMFPYPLSEKSFLVAYSYKRPERMSGSNFGLYYVDVWGHKELIHRDKRMSVAFLAPLRKTPRPPVLPDIPAVAGDGPRFATAFVQNVLDGWPDTPPGAIKYLRISQKVPWPCVRDETKACGFNDLHWMPAAWEQVLGLCDWGAARVIGIVPVEADGSAHFKVPADQPVYFQALDEDYLEVRRMRSNVTFKSGENRSCIGCHESKGNAMATPPNTGTRLALRRPPSVPVPPAWGDRLVPDFEQHIQPIFDQHCVRCHGEKEPKGGLEFTARKIDGYVQPYRTLFGLKATDATPFSPGWWQIWRPNDPPLSKEAAAYGKTYLQNLLCNPPPPAQLVTVADYTGGVEVTRPRQVGSANSKLTLTLRRDDKHRQEVKLSDTEWISLVTWVDLNAQYWGTFVEKDTHFASKRGGRNGGAVVPPRRVTVIFPDPWERPPAGEWIWQDQTTVTLK